MIKKILGSSLVLVAAFFVLTPTSASALAANYNSIIDDAIFDNVESMDASQIDTFLNSFPSSCISTNSGFSAPDPTGYNPNQGFLFGGNVSAGTVIYHAAQAYGINPEVLLATLQKEQSLVTGSAGCYPNNPDPTWPLASPNTPTANKTFTCTVNGASTACTYACSYSGGCMNIALGYNCPGYCKAADENFSRQIISASWLLTFDRHRSEGQNNWYVNKPNWDNSDDLGFCYSGYDVTGGPYYLCPDQASHANDPYISHGGQYVVDGTVVTVSNGATAALFDYTPHLHGQDLFVTNFTNWFGSTHAPLYSWSIQSFTYANGDNLLTPGVTEQVTLKALNTGNTPWYNYGDHVVRLGTWEPADTSSNLYSPGWLSPSRPAALTESQVLPGDVGTFTFPITLSSTGTFVQSLNLVVENSQWMTWPGFRPTIIGATSPYQWQIGSITYGNGTGVMIPGTTQLVTLVARNTGNIAWSKTTGPPIRLATWLPGTQSSLVAQDWISPIRVVDMNETTVNPGQTAGFQFLIRAPTTQGLYYEKFNLVAEGQAWFNDPGFTLYVKSGAYAWQPIWSSISTGSTTISKGQSFTITIRAKNIGDSIWYGGSSGSPPIRLGTSDPLNRGSNLYNPSWISGIRPAGLIEATVPPGQEGTFSFQATAPQAAETISEAFSLVAEGEQWFAGPDVTFNLTIK